jgi:hypothetical protein
MYPNQNHEPRTSSAYPEAAEMLGSDLDELFAKKLQAEGGRKMSKGPVVDYLLIFKVELQSYLLFHSQVWSSASGHMAKPPSATLRHIFRC